MKLAISSIAWSPEEDGRVAELLTAEGVHAIELAPTTWRERPLDAPADAVLALRRAWEDHGISIVSLQSLLYGRPDLQLFADHGSRAAMLDHLRRMVDFAAALGARALVFGSPGNRRRGELSSNDAQAIAAEFFRTLGEHAIARDAVICLEANPPEYGCDFVTTTAEAVELCGLIGHAGIRVNGDLGGMTLSDEKVADSITRGAAVLGHFHASEPYLAPLGAGADHVAAGAALRECGYGGWVSIEMRAAAGGGGNLAAVARALRRAKADYFKREPVHQP